jgi:hypothetical protein
MQTETRDYAVSDLIVFHDDMEDCIDECQLELSPVLFRGAAAGQDEPLIVLADGAAKSVTLRGAGRRYGTPSG